MRFLFLTNFYPPAGSGGYEQWCQEVAEGFRRRGHEVVVLTSRNDRKGIGHSEPEWIHRELHLEMAFESITNAIRFFSQRGKAEKENLVLLSSLVAGFKPEIVLIWGMWNLHRSLAARLEELAPGKVVYYMADYWPTLPSQHKFYWDAPARNWATRIPKSLLKPIASLLLSREDQPALALERVIFPSEFLRDELRRRGIKMGETKVIYGGVNTRLFSSGIGAMGSKNGRPLSLLYAGRLAPEKGVDIAIEAIRILVHERGIKNVCLALVGSGGRDYVIYLRNLVKEANLEGKVTFLGARPKQAMPDLYKQFDVSLFTSTWQEPFGRVLVEAMASGVAVVGTATGGAGEILSEGENALVFTPGNAADMADKITLLLEKPDLRDYLVENGRRIAQDKFDIQRMIGEVEAYLLRVGG
jgi:glycogen synthase